MTSTRTNMTRNIVIRAFAAIAMMACGLNAMAVTDAEMDEAKAIAAKFYVRYINNGAGYLDNWLPKSMSDLEKKVSNKTDKDNLRKFKSVGTPTDYASWDKDMLVAYWSDKFFAENGSQLDPKAAQNAMCRKQIKQAVGRMAVAAPVPAAAEPAAAEPAPEETAKPETPEEAAETAEAIDSELARVDAEMQEAQDIVDREAAAPEPTTHSGTWVYIMVLAILVAVVIFLVVYASRTMKGNARPKKESEPETAEETEEEEETAAPVPVPMPAPARSVAEDSRMREKYAEALAARAEEIRALNRQLNDMELLAGKLKDENRRLTAEVEQLRKYVTTSQPAAAHSHQPAHEHPQPQRQPQRNAAKQGTREIYLGRVNSRGIFVRADRHAVDGQSIYKLTTADGQTGTYTLIHNPLIEEQVLEDPGKWLAGGCFAKDIFDTDGKQGICTETPGTAVFRDGAWRVERKAKIRFC